MADESVSLHNQSAPAAPPRRPQKQKPTPASDSPAPQDSGDVGG